MSVESNRYDASALVNKGNCMLQRGDMEGARDCYLEAVGVEADCVDAIYNLGLVNKRLERSHPAARGLQRGVRRTDLEDRCRDVVRRDGGGSGGYRD